MFRTLSASSSGVLKTILVATGACHGSGWYTSCEDVQGRLPLHYVIVYLGLGYISSRPVAAYTVFSTPDDGRRKRPKHVE
jgi:hypothetical protein